MEPTETGIKKKGARALIGACVTIFLPGTMVFCLPGVLSSYWRLHFGMSRGAVGNTLFILLTGVGLFMFIVGRLQTRYGIRKMISFGAVVCGLNLILPALASSPWVIYLWAFINGSGSCFIYIPALTTVQLWHPSRKGFAAGLVNLSFASSAAVMAPVFAWALQTIGYRPMLLTLAGLTFAVSLTAAQFTEGPAPSEKPTPAGRGGSVPPSASLTATEALTTPEFWFIWLTWALMGSAGIAMVTLSTAYGQARGYGLETAVIILTAFNVTNGLSRFVGGWLSDLYGRTRTMSLTFLAAAGAYLALPHLESLAGICLAAMLIGAGFGTLFAVSAALTADCFGLLHFGAIFGLVFTAYGFLAGFLGPALSGLLLDKFEGRFSPVFLYLAIFCLISAFLITRARPVQPAA